MGRLLRCALVVWTVFAAVPARAAEPVDLLLVLAADVSRSVDHDKFELQRQGYAAAISDPRVLDAIRSGPHSRIAVLFLEWSGLGNQKVVIDWTTIDGPQAAPEIRRSTSGVAALFCRPHIDQRRHRFRRRAIRARAFRLPAPHCIDVLRRRLPFQSPAAT